MAFELIQTRVHLAIVELLRPLADGLVQEWLRIELRVDSKDVEDNTGRGAVVTSSDDVPVADDEDQLALVVVVEVRERVDGTAERVLALGITRHLANDELVLQLRLTLARELKRSQDYKHTSVQFSPL